MIIQCKCGCGAEFEEYNKWGYKREYVKGHSRRGKTSSDATKKLLSIINSGEKNPMFGKPGTQKGLKHSPETRQLISDTNSGENNPMFGKHHSPKTKQKMSKIRKEKYSGENNPNWQGGIARLPYCPIWTPWLREQIKERDNHQCMNPDCTKEITKNNLLGIHHIDYDKKNCSTNNLITLCNSCNSRANFNREYWKDFYSNILMGNN